MTDATTSTTDYLRVRIIGTLVARGLLHCGDGETLEPDQWQSAGDPRQGKINSVCIGAKGPYLPASTLRGSLRARCSRPERLFGTAHGDEGQAGATRVFDAERLDSPGDPGDLHWNRNRRTTLRDGVSLDPITGTAAEGRLFAFEVVPEGTRFRFELQADDISRDELSQLLGLLAGWDGKADTAIGRGRTKGWGGIAWQPGYQVSAITDVDIRDWLNGDANASPSFKPIKAPDPAEATGAATIRLTATLRPTTPLLINDTSRVVPRDADQQGDQKAKETKPQLEFMRTASDEALIPGSSLRGALRAQAARILATIAHQCFDRPASEAAEIADTLVKQIFGSEQHRSQIWIGDAHGSGTSEHRQFFNAICRFTGGVADGKLYWVRAADCPELTLTCTLDQDQRRRIDGNWWKGLLLLLVRDFYEDQIAIGWGKSRGYGAFALHLKLEDDHTFDDFESLLRYLRDINADDTPRTWIQALHTRIKDEIPAPSIGAATGGKP